MDPAASRYSDEYARYRPAIGENRQYAGRFFTALPDCQFTPPVVESSGFVSRQYVVNSWRFAQTI